MILTFSPVVSWTLWVVWVSIELMGTEGWTRRCPSQLHFSGRRPNKVASLIQLHVHVATGFLMSHAGDQGDRPSTTRTAKNSLSSKKTRRKQKLSRPERKALERKKNKKLDVDNNKKQKSNTPGYSLHSTAVSQLTADSTAEDVLRAIKRAQKLHDHHDLRTIANFLINDCDVSFAYGYRGSLLARLAVAALRWENHHVARRAIEIRSLEYRASMQPMESAAIVRGLLRVHNVTDALDIVADELSLPLEGTLLETPESREKIKHRARSLASVASRHLFEDEPAMAVLALQMMKEMGPIARQIDAEELAIPWLRLLQGAARCEVGRRNGSIPLCGGLPAVHLPCNLAYSVLSAMSSFPSENDDQVFEALSNALVRQVHFVTGAVNMEGLPQPDRGEAVFIGRSNVGKSSLVNMITNRKSLAYTSKIPGKTQQFNFFSVNDNPVRVRKSEGDVSLEVEKDSFYLVDLPGIGFAKVSDAQRQKWASFMREYLSNRKNLKVVFHLIDSRHGPINEDSKIMNQVGESLPNNVAYVIILTKADKNVKGNLRKNLGKVSKDVMDNLRRIMHENNVGNSPVLLTSSQSKLGRDDIWRYLQQAAEG